MVQVRVTEVNVARKRIGLTMRADGGTAQGDRNPRSSGGAKPDQLTARKPHTPRSGKPRSPVADQSLSGALGAALFEAMKKR